VVVVVESWKLKRSGGGKERDYEAEDGWRQEATREKDK
jgi:hypothetical protein